MVKSSGTKVGFTTNGTQLNDNHITELLESQVDIMGISLAGTTAKTSQRFRSGCDFEFIDSAMRRLRNSKQQTNRSKPNIHLAFMLLRSNIHELSQLPALADEWGVSQIVVNNLSFVGNLNLQQESLFLYPELWPEVELSLNKAKAEAAKLAIEFHYYRPDIANPNPICTENVLGSCFISYRGDVSPCVLTNISVKEDETVSYFFQNQEYPVEKYLYGNINKQSLQEVWCSDKARQFQLAFEQRLSSVNPAKNTLPYPCRHCYKLFEKMDG